MEERKVLAKSCLDCRAVVCPDLCSENIGEKIGGAKEKMILTPHFKLKLKLLNFSVS